MRWPAFLWRGSLRTSCREQIQRTGVMYSSLCLPGISFTAPARTLLETLSVSAPMARMRSVTCPTKAARALEPRLPTLLSSSTVREMCNAEVENCFQLFLKIGARGSEPRRQTAAASLNNASFKSAEAGHCCAETLGAVGRR